MNRQFILKKTNQLSTTERDLYLELFFRVFRRRMSTDQFDRKYLYTPTGYSYHGLMIIDGLIVGAYNTIPYLYKYFDKEVMFALSVDTMIDEQYRGGPFSLLKIAKLVLDPMRQDGVSFAFGFPNDKAYEFTVRVLKWQDIGELDYYVLLRNVGAIIPKLRCFNSLSRAYARVLVGLPGHQDATQNEYNIEKANGKAFEKHRYDASYGAVDLQQGGKCVYKIYTEPPGIKTLYVIDVCPLNRVCFDEAIARVYAECGRSIDMILYVGALPFRPRRLRRLPESRKPRRVRMCGKIIAPTVVDDRIFQIGNWKVNISNFDVR
ncbi:MAG: hypothetical protein ACETVZ_09480 [Phycisphaerae bacterium]